MGRRRCSRRFALLAGGGVRVTWACGAQQEFPEETAVDVEYLADHLPHHHHHHHHRHHLHHKEKP